MARRPDAPHPADLAARRLGHLQVGFGLLWLVDGLLGLQPANLGPGLAAGIAANAMGEPGVVRALAIATGHFVGAHGLGVGIAIAAVQLALGAGVITPRSRRAALIASVPFAIGVWVLGEAFGAVASGFAMMPSGAPGPALLYALAAVVLLPPRRDAAPLEGACSPAACTALGERRVAVLWVATWALGGVLQAVPVRSLGFKLAANLEMTSLGEPRALAGSDRLLARVAAAHGPEITAVLIAMELAIGAAALTRGRARNVLLGLGVMVCATCWVVAENLGGLLSGSASDVGSMPVYVLLAVALWSIRRTRPIAADAGGARFVLALE